MLRLAVIYSCCGTWQVYGFVPDKSSGRIFIFILLIVIHATQTTCKILALGLLAHANPFWLVGYVAADWVLYLTYKVLRRDVVYWVPGFGFFSSLIIRILVKVLVDFTGCIPPRRSLPIV